MALPTVHALESCADFSTAVQPFLPQLYDLPHQLLDIATGHSGRSLLQLYAETNPLISGFAASVALGAVFLVLAEINRNYSQVDRAWSVLPTVYIAHFAAWARLTGVPHQRVDAALLFSAIWSARLSFNYWRKGGYGIGHEDYRWEIIRQYIPKFAFHVFNWTFISFIQSILLFLIAAPVYTILLASTIEPDLTSADIASVAIELALILTEYIADEQQWGKHAYLYHSPSPPREIPHHATIHPLTHTSTSSKQSTNNPAVYQSAKKQYRETNKVTRGFQQADLDRGFITTGLWGHSRHPNFAAEQSIWFVLYQWSCYATKTLYHWTGAGPAFLVLLFQGSTWLTELITAGKYPQYADYQRQVGAFAPWGFKAYDASSASKSLASSPKVIRTSELAKKAQEKETKKQK
ncbi:uncharacterized protein C8A04DRAFT_9298 [Dichotomopilus funicola]|uniref:Uncharacterized protein n=1 Tax=Dichotomopilus funicola TaxID=1934379 RepID=A0AAN6V8W8_9PEZI|nr:hypothetical protein C8A04DRAFT_9298 [Dichotomopilus funicola]